MCIETIKKVLVPVWYKESMIGLSIGKSGSNFAESEKKEFKKKLFEAIERLRRRVDEENLSNANIRKEIKKLSTETDASIGQAQKVINVYLKYYCILYSKPLEELDCPLDKSIMGKYKDENHRPVLLKDLMDFGEYERWQELLREKGHGVRLKPDIECYDQNRIREFLE